MAETSVTFPNATNSIALNLAFSLPTYGETNPDNAPDFLSVTTPLTGLAINTTIPVEIAFDRFIYTIILTGSITSMAAWEPMTEHKVLDLTFASEVTGDFPRLDNWLNTGGGAGQGYFYFEVNGAQRSDTEEVPFYNGVQGTYPSFDLFVESNTSLPINLVSFTAAKFETRSSLLSWVTASEENSSHFVIQRSHDRRTWATIGKVEAAGFSHDIKSYEFMDYLVYNGLDAQKTFYYRLQMVDMDGQMKNSPIENVVFGNNSITGREFTVYPNPASEGVQIEWEQGQVEQPTTLEFYDATGRLVFTQKVAGNSNQEYVDFTYTNIKAGLYLLRILSGTEPIEHKQIVVGQNR